MNFTVKTTEQVGSVIFHLSGKLLDEQEAIRLHDKIDQEIQAGNNHIIFDLSDLTHCNSTGINVFIRTLTKSRTNGGDTCITAVNKELSKIFEITKTKEIFNVFDSNQEAETFLKKHNT